MNAADYRTEADEYVKLALTCINGYQHLRTEDLIGLAQVNATLALAEQQRIANLIALAHTDQDETARAALWEEVTEAIRVRYVLRKNIAEGLGL